MSEYNKMLHELVKQCEKASADDARTATLFSELLNRFTILIKHYEQLEKRHLQALNSITDFHLFRHELTELMEKGKAFLDKK